VAELMARGDANPGIEVDPPVNLCIEDLLFIICSGSTVVEAIEDMSGTGFRDCPPKLCQVLAWALCFAQHKANLSKFITALQLYWLDMDHPEPLTNLTGPMGGCL